MPHYSSPAAGDIEAPDIETAARWLMHRYAHDLFGPGAIVRQFEASAQTAFDAGITARAYLGAPAPGDGRLDFWPLEVYPVFLNDTPT